MVFGLLAAARLPSTEAGFERVGCCGQSLLGCPLEGGGVTTTKNAHHTFSSGLSGDFDGKDLSVLLFENYENFTNEFAKSGLEILSPETQQGGLVGGKGGMAAEGRRSGKEGFLSPPHILSPAHCTHFD